MAFSVYEENRQKRQLSAFFGLPILLASLILQPLTRSKTAHADEAGTSKDLVQSLCEKWELQRQALALVEINYRSLRRKVPADHVIRRDEVRKLLNQLAVNNDKRSFNEVAAAFVPKLKGMNRTWGTGRFLLNGQSFVSEVSYPSSPDRPLTVARDNGYEIHVSYVTMDKTNGKVQVDIMREQTRTKMGARENR